jgi:hypothetical protein
MPFLNNEDVNPFRYVFIHAGYWERFKKLLLPKLSSLTPGSGRSLPINLETGHLLDILNICFPSEFRFDVEENEGQVRLYVKKDYLDPTTIVFRFVTTWPGSKVHYQGTISSENGLNVAPELKSFGNTGNVVTAWRESYESPERLYEYLIAINYFDPLENESDHSNPELTTSGWKEVFYYDFTDEALHSASTLLVKDFSVFPDEDNETLRQLFVESLLEYQSLKSGTEQADVLINSALSAQPTKQNELLDTNHVGMFRKMVAKIRHFWASILYYAVIKRIFKN